MSLRILLLSCLLFPSLESIAQRYSDVLYYNQAYSPKVRDGGKGDAAIFESNLTLRIPLYMDDSTTYFLFNLSLNRTHYKFAGSNQIDAFGGGYAGFIFTKDWTSKISSLMTLQVGSFSNMRDYNWSGPQYLGGGIARYQYDPSVRLGAGFLLGYRVRFIYFVPLLEVYWEINKQWDVLAVAPGNLVITYQKNRNQGLGFEYEALGNVFSINRQGIDYLSESSPRFPWTYLRFGFFGDQFLGENIAIRLYGGLDVARNLLAFDTSNLEFPESRQSIFDLGTYPLKPFINIGLFYRIRNE